MLPVWRSVNYTIHVCTLNHVHDCTTIKKHSKIILEENTKVQNRLAYLRSFQPVI